jgi:hypothetical protein
MTDDNFVERVHAYSKWLVGLEIVFEDDEDVSPRGTDGRRSIGKED